MWNADDAINLDLLEPLCSPVAASGMMVRGPVLPRRKRTKEAILLLKAATWLSWVNAGLVLHRNIHVSHLVNSESSKTIFKDGIATLRRFLSAPDCSSARAMSMLLTKFW